MTSWRELETEAPDFAARAKAFLDARVHKTIATIKRDGSPRISGTETIFAEGELWFGSMWRAMKALDLQRNPAFALHSGSTDPPEWDGDAKVTGSAEEEKDLEVVARVVPGAKDGEMHLFRADITSVVVVSLNPEKTKLVIESWRAGRGITRTER